MAHETTQACVFSSGKMWFTSHVQNHTRHHAMKTDYRFNMCGHKPLGVTFNPTLIKVSIAVLMCMYNFCCNHVNFTCSYIDNASMMGHTSSGNTTPSIVDDMNKLLGNVSKKDHISSGNGDSKKTLSVKDMYQHLIIVTALSDNHVSESQDMFSTVRNCFPEKKILVYDLGLNQANRRKLTQKGNIEIRPFPFKEYSNVTYLKDLYCYGWKPIIAYKVSLEYDVILYGDSSLRMKSCNITPALEHLLKFPILSGHPVSHKAIEFTHDGMIKYLKFPKTRTEMADIGTYSGGLWLLLVNSESQKKIIEPWLDCALHKECMAPAGSKRGPCGFNQTHDGRYIGCHRYDQSALNLILAREYGLDYFSRGADGTISSKLFMIKRGG